MIYSEKEQEYFYWLVHGEIYSFSKVMRLLSHGGSFEGIYNIEGKELLEKNLLTEREVFLLESHKGKLEQLKLEYHQLSKRGMNFIPYFAEEYPKCFTDISGKPLGIFVKGTLPDERFPTVAIVGARLSSDYGRQVAEHLGYELSGMGIQIVSGLAWGIDGAGHRGALRQGGNTFGVLGCGADICYPKENFDLYRKMEHQGGIISEFMPGSPPKPRNFPMRNRIISALSDIVIVVEAKEKSGSLITAGIALEQGKDVFAVPGRVFDTLSCGCNQLIRDGAGIVTCIQDILDYFGLNYEKSGRLHKKSMKGLAKNEKIVYSCLDLEPKYLEQIAIDSGLSLSECMSALLELKLNGYIIESMNQYYMKKL